MKKTTLLIISVVYILAMQSCYVTRFLPVANYRMNNIDTPEGKNLSVVGNTYSDEFVGITISVEQNYFKVFFINKTDKTIKIVWDSGSYIDPYGQAHRIYHTGIKLKDVSNIQVPSVLPSGTSIEDLVAPADYVDYSAEMGWTYQPLISGDSYYDNEADAKRSLVNFKPIRLLIPVEVGDETREYTFTFNSEELDVEQVKLKDVMATSYLIGGGAALVGAVIGVVIGLM